jgi:hypothetical protein
MIRVELVAAVAGLKGLPPNDDGRRITAVMVMLEEVLPEFLGHGRKPWRAVPWLDCASHLLGQMDTDIRGAREHVSAARDLLASE